MLAVIVGVVVAAAAMTAFIFWMHGLIERRGFEEVERSARRSIGLAEQRIDEALATLDRLAAQGAGKCGAGDVEALQSAVFHNAVVKAISVLAADGGVLCGSAPIMPGPRAILSSQRAEAAGGVLIDVIRIGQRDIMVRVSRRRDGTAALAALIPAALFDMVALQPDGAFTPQLRLTMRDETPIVERGAAPGAGWFSATQTSPRYGLAATVSLPREALQGEAERLKDQATAFAAVIFVAILALAVLLPRWRRKDPIIQFEQAIAADQFVPYYQPVVDIRTGRLRGAEVLVRWCKPDGTHALPSSFIPFAESSGLVVPLTGALMRRVRDEIGEVLSSRPDVKVSFNLAAPHFADDSIVAEVREIFQDSSISLRQVMLEVTERQPLQNLGAARRVIAGLQELGCAVAIDDVGTGHGGLSYILKLGADTIKIDKLFIDAIGSDHHSTTILETLVDLARSMRMDVVAEGVETFEQVLKLRDLGILAAQGHVFAPPLPGPSFLQLVEAIAPLPRSHAGSFDDESVTIPFPGTAAA
jgi:sensor c-di-GMP phosphodiesterase-like protein